MRIINHSQVRSIIIHNHVNIIRRIRRMFIIIQIIATTPIRLKDLLIQTRKVIKTYL